MNASAIEAELRRDVAQRLGEARARELAAAVRAMAEAIALLYAEPLELEDEEPDYVR